MEESGAAAGAFFFVEVDLGLLVAGGVKASLTYCWTYGTSMLLTSCDEPLSSTSDSLAIGRVRNVRWLPVSACMLTAKSYRSNVESVIRYWLAVPSSDFSTLRLAKTFSFL